MKKIITILAVIAMFGFQGCEGPEGPPGQDGADGLIAEVFELRNVNFVNNPNDNPDLGYYIFGELNPVLFDGDVVLIYRKAAEFGAATPVWQSIPRTLFLEEGELDYDFDFSKGDYYIYAGGTYDVSSTPEFLNNQTFRIVIIPGPDQVTSKSSSKKVDLSNYNEVIKAYNIDDSKVKVLN